MARELTRPNKFGGGALVVAGERRVEAGGQPLGKVLLSCSMPMNATDTALAIVRTSSGAEALANKVRKADVVSAFGTVPSEVLFNDLRGGRFGWSCKSLISRALGGGSPHWTIFDPGLFGRPREAVRIPTLCAGIRTTIP
jgi:hypothetical protein